MRERTKLEELYRMATEGQKADRLLSSKSKDGKMWSQIGGTDGVLENGTNKKTTQGGDRTKPKNTCALGALTATGNGVINIGGEIANGSRMKVDSSERSNEQKKNGEFKFDFDSSSNSEPELPEDSHKLENSFEYCVSGRERKMMAMMTPRLSTRKCC